MTLSAFETLESEVRSYCRAWPAVFCKARGSVLIDERGQEYIDFFAGAGTLAFGHNHPELRRALVTYLEEDGITHSLDMATTAKRTFLQRFEEVILRPRGYQYRMLFPGPTGTNAVEVALKLARRATGRTSVIAFTNGFHGMTLGSLALTGNRSKRSGAGVPLQHVRTAPFDGYLGPHIDTVQHLERLLEDPSSGVEPPAAFVLETVQAEGGVNVASARWLRRLQSLARRVGALLVVDDIQVGCGRTGAFFSFEEAGLQPDIVCLSKALSGYGLPMSMVLVRPEHDVLAPGEHNGTFRGHMPAFVTAAAALRFWEGSTLSDKVRADGARVAEVLHELGSGGVGQVRGRGLIRGLAFADPAVATAVARAAFVRGLVIETAGPRDEVLKVLPPLVIDGETLEQGLSILKESVAFVLGHRASVGAA
jgi:diaminobutyrate-2-oxoglutarate transaminase